MRKAAVKKSVLTIMIVSDLEKREDAPVRTHPRCLFGISLLLSELCLSFWYDRDNTLVVIATMEIHSPIDEGKQRVILTDGHTVARIVVGTTLTNDNVASLYLLTTPNFHAKSLGCTLAAVLRTTYTFFMCHNSVPPLSDYLFNFNLSELLTMAITLTGVLATLHLEDNHLVALHERIHYFYYYLCTFYTLSNSTVLPASTSFMW